MKFLCLILFLLLSACGGGGNSAEGGSEFGNPTRPVSGVVKSANANGTNCPADTAMVTDSTGKTTIASVQISCSFSFELVAPKAYVLSFLKDNVFVASMIFNSGSARLDTSVFFVSVGSTPIDLGDIIVSGTVASPTNNPGFQNDRDDDGEDDFEDADDDNDGISDGDEEDCDLDGFLDDDDESEDECTDQNDGNGDGGGDDESAGTVLEVKPRNGENDVNLDDEIEIRLGCVADETTVNAAALSIVSGGDTVTCLFEFDEAGDRIRCDHDSDVFLSDALYTATVSGIECEDGTPVSEKSWSWSTREED